MKLMRALAVVALRRVLHVAVPTLLLAILYIWILILLITCIFATVMPILSRPYIKMAGDN
ncbi:MAG: hypothetical protein GX638_05590 [Crenarchaeota archaeon]|nr:hypothetical protein [Thermoproteota archaeon]